MLSWLISRRCFPPRNWQSLRLASPCFGCALVLRTCESKALLFPLRVWLANRLLHSYPLFTLFLPYYLQSHGAQLGDGSTYQTYRDYAITSTVGIFGPILASGLVEIPFLGRRRTMSLTALCAAAFAGAFTTVRSEADNIAFSSMIGFWQNAFYAVLYS
jgi:hypothetical protein